MDGLRVIPGHPGYFCGPDGSIWSAKRGMATRMATFRRDRSGHLGVNLTHDGQYKMYSVSRLIALAWLGEPPTIKHVVMHLDDNPDHNAPSNLAYGLPADNSAQMTARNRQARGERCWSSRLTAENVQDIRIRVMSGERQSALASEFDVPASTISSICRRKSWKHI